MTIATSKLAELLYPGIAEIFGHKYKEHEVKYKEFFDIKKSDKAFEKEHLTFFILFKVINYTQY